MTRASAIKRPPAPAHAATPGRRPALQRRGPGGASHAGGECEGCRARRARTEGAPAIEPLPPSVREVVAGGGRPPDASTRGSMEAAFGHDFTGVRVHADARAAASAADIGARAYTVG